MLRLPNNHRLTLIKRGNRSTCWKCGNEIVSTQTGSPVLAGEGRLHFFWSLSAHQQGRNDQVSMLFVYFTFFFFFFIFFFFFKAEYLICFSMAGLMMQKYCWKLAETSGSRRFLSSTGEPGIRGRAILAWSKFYFVSLGTRCSYLLISNKTAAERVHFCSQHSYLLERIEHVSYKSL